MMIAEVKKGIPLSIGMPNVHCKRLRMPTDSEVFALSCAVPLPASSPQASEPSAADVPEALFESPPEESSAVAWVAAYVQPAQALSAEPVVRIPAE
jgi:hypothetical protein